MLPPLSRLARTLLRPRVGPLCAAIALLGGGCLLDYPESPGPLRNRAPRIEERNVEPSDRLVVLDPSSPEGCKVVFSLRVADPDPRDVLEVEWYVDFNRQPTGAPSLRRDHFNRVVPNGSPNESVEVRDASATWTATTTSPGNPLAVPGLHVVEAFVTDGAIQMQERDGTFIITSDPKPNAEDPSLTDETFVVSYAWFVSTPPGCPVESGGAP